MDYASIHGQDESNFTFRSQHRLPTESAAAALNALKDGNGKSQGISLGKDMEGVDGMISDVGGVRRGVVTEIWGPPGVGKTCFGYVAGRDVTEKVDRWKEVVLKQDRMELAATALREGGKVLWLSAQDPMPGPRLDRILAKSLFQSKTPSQHSHEAQMTGVQERRRLIRKFRHLPWPTIVHLSARLLMSDDPKSGFPPSGTSLFVIDKLDELIDKESPRDLPEDEEEKEKRGNKPPESLLNYWKTTHHAIRMLNKFAAKHNVAVVVLTPIDTKQEIMVSAIDTQAWEMGVATRIMLMQQDMYANRENIGINVGRTLKKDGVVGDGQWFGFSVEENGLREEHVSPRQENGHELHYDINVRASSHVIQREVGSELGWDRPVLENQYSDEESEPDLDRLSIGNSPPPPSSPPILTKQAVPQHRSIHPRPSARTPSPPPLQQTQNGTPVRSVPASNIFAEDPLPGFEDEAPQVSYLSHEISRSAGYRRYDLDMPPPPASQQYGTALSQQYSQQYAGLPTLPRTAYTSTNPYPRQQTRGGERSVPGYSPQPRQY